MKFEYPYRGNSRRGVGLACATALLVCILWPAPTWGQYHTRKHSTTGRNAAGWASQSVQAKLTLREELPSGTWGCPGPIRVHPLDHVPSVVFWKQSQYGAYDDESCAAVPAIVEGLRWAVYVGWPDPDRPDAVDTLWRYYDIPSPTGDPCLDRLERPRIQFEYDPEHRPAVVIGRDDGGLRYEFDVPGQDPSPVFMGHIDLIRPGELPGEAGIWIVEQVDFGSAYTPVSGRLDYPDIAFDDLGHPIVSAIGYHAFKDDIENDKPYEVLMLNRKRDNGSWKAQRVLQNFCGSTCCDICTAMEDGSGLFSDLTWEQGSESQASRGINGLASCSCNGGLGISPASSPPCFGTTPGACPQANLQFVLSYPSLVPGPGIGPAARLAFGYGLQKQPSSLYENYVRVVDYDINPFSFNSNSPLPLLNSELLQLRFTSSILNDMVYVSADPTGNLAATFQQSYSEIVGGVVDWFTVRHWQDPAWVKDYAASIPSPIVDYDRSAFRWWTASAIAQRPDGEAFGYLTPNVEDMHYPIGLILDEEGQEQYGASLTYMDGANLNCGADNDQPCPLSIVDAISSGEEAFEASLAFGAFDFDGLSEQWTNRAIISYHGNMGNELGVIVTSPENAGPTTFPTVAGYGDFNFDQVVNDLDYAILVDAEAASADGSWTNHPVCDYDTNGKVDGVEREQFEAMYCTDCAGGGAFCQNVSELCE